MDSLVCDLTNALNSKPSLFKNKKSIKNHKNLSSKEQKRAILNRIDRQDPKKIPQYDNIHSSSSSETKKFASKSNKSRIRHRKIMNLLLAAKASIYPTDQTMNGFNAGIQSLVRVKQPKSFNSSRSVQCQRKTRRSIKKSKRLQNTKVYKIQKIYRFHSNYRLHCIKLRRLQKKMVKSNNKIFPLINQEKMSLENTTHSSSVSTITTSPSYSSCYTTTDVESSSISDCYNEMDNLRINSDSDSRLKMGIKNQLVVTKKAKTNAKRKVLSCRQRKNFNTSITSQSSLNLNSLNHKKILSFKRRRSKAFMNRRLFNQFSAEGVKTEYEDSNNEEINIDSDVENCKKSHLGLDIKINVRKIDQEADDEYSSESCFKKEFECVPWWNECENEFVSSSSSSATLNNSISQTALSNYQRLNFFNSQDEQKQLDHIINGALDLMDQSSVQSFKNRTKFFGDQINGNRKKRFLFANTNENSLNRSDNNLSINQPIICAPIPESNLGNKMLKKMGWQPGTSLGTVKTQNDPFSLKEPIVVFKRPKRQGLGFSDNSGV